MMVRDTLAVPTRGAAVEREFNLSNQIVTHLHAWLHIRTILNIVMYRSRLIRCKRELKTFDVGILSSAKFGFTPPVVVVYLDSV
jgi:hypothetical protein